MRAKAEKTIKTIEFIAAVKLIGESNLSNWVLKSVDSVTNSQNEPTITSGQTEPKLEKWRA